MRFTYRDSLLLIYIVKCPFWQQALQFAILASVACPCHRLALLTKPDKFGLTPLIVAAASGSITATHENIRQFDTAFARRAAETTSEVAHVLNMYKQQEIEWLCARTTDGFTALHAAVISGHKDSFEVLISRMWDVVDKPSIWELLTSKSIYGSNTLQNACAFACSDVVRQVIDAMRKCAPDGAEFWNAVNTAVTFNPKASGISRDGYHQHGVAGTSCTQGNVIMNVDSSLESAFTRAGTEALSVLHFGIVNTHHSESVVNALTSVLEGDGSQPPQEGLHGNMRVPDCTQRDIVQ